MTRFLPLLSLLLLLAASSLQAQAPRPLPPSLPLDVADTAWHPLRETVDTPLQQQLTQRLQRNATWKRLLANERMAVAVVDLRDPAAPRFAPVNGDLMMYAASLPKIAILLAVVQGFEDGTVAETPEALEDLNAMIRVSSNAAATRSIDRAGGIDAVNTVLTDPRYQLYDEESGGGLWVGKAYAKSGVRHGEPLKDISHAASVTQVSRFYYLLATGRLVSRARSRQMLTILADPGLNHKLVHTLSTEAPRARLFRKSGTWRNWHADSALVWGPERRYIVVCLVEDPNGERIIRNVARAVEEVMGTHR